LAPAARTARCRTVLEFLCLTVARLGIVLHDLAFEDPDLDPDDAIGSHRLYARVIDVGAQRVQRHTTLTIPFGPRNFRSAQTTGHVDPDTQGPHPHRVLNSAFHRTTERYPALKLLRNALANQRRVQLGLAHFNDVEVQFRFGHPGNFLAQGFDVCAFLAD